MEASDGRTHLALRRLYFSDLRAHSLACIISLFLDRFDRNRYQSGWNYFNGARIASAFDRLDEKASGTAHTN